MSLSFVSEFQHKLSQFPVDIDSTFEGTHGKPMVFPGMQAELPEVQVRPKKVRVNLRSVRAPKFSVEYEVWNNMSIYGLKEMLLVDPNGPLAGTKHSITSLRIMAKAKAIGDMRCISDLPHDFTVMFSQAEGPEVFIPAQVYVKESATLAAEKPAVAVHAAPAAQVVTEEPATESTDSVSKTETERPDLAAPAAYHAENKGLLLAELYEVLDKYGRPDLFGQIMNLI